MSWENGKECVAFYGTWQHIAMGSPIVAAVIVACVEEWDATEPSVRAPWPDWEPFFYDTEEELADRALQMPLDAFRYMASCGMMAWRTRLWLNICRHWRPPDSLCRNACQTPGGSTLHGTISRDCLGFASWNSGMGTPKRIGRER